MRASGAGYVVGPESPGGALIALVRARGVVWSLLLREVQVRHRQAVLGALWALVQPLALAAMAWLVFHRFVGAGSDGAPYASFAFVGLVAWTFFQSGVSGAVPSLVANATLVRRIWFPREALPIAAVGALGVDLAIGLVTAAVFALAQGVVPGSEALFVLALVPVLVAFALGLGLLGAAVNVHHRDVKHALPLLLQLLFFATPIVYPLSAVPERWRGAFVLNPLTGVIEGWRACLLHGRLPDTSVVLPGAVVAFVLLLAAYAAFKAADRRFADVV